MSKRKELLILGGCVSAIIVIVLAIATALFSSQNHAIQLIRDQKFAEAAEVYTSDIRNNTEKRDEFKEQLDVYIGSLIDEYNQGEKTDSDIMGFFENIQKYDFYADLNLVEYHSTYYLIADSKEAFKKAEELMKSKDYLEAITYYEQISQRDTNNSVKDSKIEVAKEKLLKQAENFVKNGDYTSAINLLNKCLDKFNEKEFSEAYNNYITELVNNTIASTEALFSQEKDYTKAIENLKKIFVGLDYPQDPAFEPIYDEIEKYSEYQPKPLTSLEPIKESNYVACNNIFNKDVNETVYSNDCFYPTGGTSASAVADDEDEASVSYYLNAQYTELTGTIFRPYKSLSCENAWENPTVFKIYGDGVLLYEGPNITQSTFDPIDFSVDVTGVRELKIVLMGVWTTNDSGWPGVYSRYPKLSVTNLTLKK